MKFGNEPTSVIFTLELVATHKIFFNFELRNFEFFKLDIKYNAMVAVAKGEVFEKFSNMQVNPTDCYIFYDISS